MGLSFHISSFAAVVHHPLLPAVAAAVPYPRIFYFQSAANILAPEAPRAPGQEVDAAHFRARALSGDL